MYTYIDIVLHIHTYIDASREGTGGELQGGALQTFNVIFVYVL